MEPQKGEIKKDYFTLKKINPVIRFLTISDVLIIGGFGLVAPIFAIFITKSIEGGTVEVAGIAAAIYLLAKSLGQIPVAVIIDKIKGEKDDFWAVLIGSIIFSIIPILCANYLRSGYGRDLAGLDGDFYQAY